jgi:D-beta-D-heptose 7-phosphate kinase/D-beta-D-heptose 1-phosphate adenosyltransferase
METIPALLALLPRLQTARVLVIGDTILDRYVTGEASRLSPEAPIAVLHAQTSRDVPGGAGNVCRNLAALGAQSFLVSIAGNDEAAERLREHLPQATFIPVPDRPTPVKIRYLAGTQQLLRVDHEVVDAMPSASEDALLDAVRQRATQIDIIILSDYGKGTLSPRVCQAIIAIGKPVIVDPKGHSYKKYAGAAYVTPNRKELREATGRPVGTDAEIEAAGRWLCTQHDIGTIVATRSEQGISIVRTDAPTVHLPTYAREVFDVSGAGDTVVAALAAALATGASITEAAQLANTAAGIVVGKRGTAVATSAELAGYWLRREHLGASGGKLMPLETAASLAALWRGQGLKVGFTNGCFDILHAGHVTMLAACRKKCDRLIIGLNTDASVRRLKGEGRPVTHETGRAAVLAALEVIDGVILFDEDTPLTLIEALRPDVLFKGADYTVATVVGAEQVLSWGGTVELIDLVPGVSTTQTIAKVLAKA